MKMTYPNYSNSCKKTSVNTGVGTDMSGGTYPKVVQRDKPGKSGDVMRKGKKYDTLTKHAAPKGPGVDNSIKGRVSYTNYTSKV